MGLIIKNNTLIKNLSIGPAAGSGGGSGIPIATNGLFMFYDAANSTSYAGSGTTMTNLVDADPGFDITLGGSPTFNSAGDGSYFSFGSNMDVEVTGMGTLLNGVTTETTVSHWIYSTSSSPIIQYGTFYFLFRNGGSPYTNSIYAGILDAHSSTQYSSRGNPYIDKAGRDGSTRWQGTNLITPMVNQWMNLTLTFGPDGLFIYTNGTSIGNPTFSGHAYQSSATLDGITEIKLLGPYMTSIRWANSAYYTRQLSDAEVLSNYEAMKTRFGHT